jgi:hypothetical protein
VARKGANRPIFEGETPPKKCPPNIGADIGAITGILLMVCNPYFPFTFLIWLCAARIRQINSFHLL